MAIPAFIKIRENARKTSEINQLESTQVNKDWQLVTRVNMPNHSFEEYRHNKTGIHYLFSYRGGFIMLMNAEGKPYCD
jgi:hypothetical protein